MPSYSSHPANIIPRFAIGLVTLGSLHFQIPNAQAAPLETPNETEQMIVQSVRRSCKSFAAHSESGIVVDSTPPQSTLTPLLSTSLETKLADAVRQGAKTIYLRSGLYENPRTVELNSAFDGITLRACPGETPVLTAPAHQPILALRDAHNITLNGLVFEGANPAQILLQNTTDCAVEQNMFLRPGTAIVLDGATANVIRRNLVVQAEMSGIELKNHSDKNLIADNTIDGTAALETHGGGVFVHGGANNRISHNLIRNTAGFGIGISNWDSDTINIANIVEYNRLQATTLTAEDSGAIYILGRSGIDTQTVVAGNVIDGVGTGNHHNVGIYLDDSTSGAVVTHNLIRRVGSDAVQIHGGSDNVVANNLLDLTEGNPSAILFQSAPADTNPTNLQSGNVIERNVILLVDEASKLFVWLEGGTPQISGNLYASSSGLVTLLPPPLSDPRARLADPLIARDAMAGHYATAQSAGIVVGFTPIDLTAAGPREESPTDEIRRPNQ